MLKNKILIVVNSGWNIVNFRMGLIRGLQEHGYNFIIASPADNYSTVIEALGCEFYNVDMQPQGLNPLHELKFMYDLFFIMRRKDISTCLFFTVKPNIFGSLIASLLGISYINNISGLGSIFIKSGFLSKILVFLYKFALKRSSCVFFQNQDDRYLFLQKKVVRFEQSLLLPGSGVDLKKFQSTGKLKQIDSAQFSFIFIGRLINDKGINEYIEAAKIVSYTHPKIKFKVLGFLGVQNPTAVSIDKMKEWQQFPFISYLGHAEDVRSFIEDSDCVVLPSYREGTPKVLLEAAAMCKPLITTNVPGCKDVVEDHLNGFLCEVRSADDLAEKMCQMIELSIEDREKMGSLGRVKMEKQFDERIVIDSYLKVIRSLY
jgi:glycosyltransferase involved in cell wall biosynthesis